MCNFDNRQIYRKERDKCATQIAAIDLILSKHMLSSSTRGELSNLLRSLEIKHDEYKELYRNTLEDCEVCDKGKMLSQWSGIECDTCGYTFCY